MNTDNKIFAAALYLANGEDCCKELFGNNYTVEFKTRTDAINYIKYAQLLSDNQKIALYCYLSLYLKLLKGRTDDISVLKNLFNISGGIEKNINEALSDDRTSYIKDLYYNSGRDLLCILKEPEDFIINLIDDILLMPVIEEKIKLKGLQTSEYEHILDKTALDTLKSNPTIKPVMKWFNDYAVERATCISYTGSYFKVTKDSIPYLYDLIEETCKILNIQNVPTVYVNDIGLNAYTVGIKKPIIVVGSACLSLLGHDELMFIIGHELGHIKSEHLLHHEFAQLIPLLGKAIGDFTFGIGDLLSTGLYIPLMEWYRKSEFTADRAGLLACQNPDAVYTVFTKLSGFPMRYYGKIDKKYILEQAKDFEELDNDTYNKVTKVLSILNQSHPWTVMRAKEIDKWISSGKYDLLLRKNKFNTHNERTDNLSTNVNIKFR